MDFDQLYKIIPNDPIKWTIKDVQQWLVFINLPKYQDVFQQQSIDGSILASLTDEDLLNELEIKQKLNRKKIISWIDQGFKYYSIYLKKLNNESDNDQHKNVISYQEYVNSNRYQKPQFPPLQIQEVAKDQTDFQKKEQSNEADEDYDAFVKNKAWDDSFDIRGIQNNLKNKKFNDNEREMLVKKIDYQQEQIEEKADEQDEQQQKFQKEQQKGEKSDKIGNFSVEKQKIYNNGNNFSDKKQNKHSIDNNQYKIQDNNNQNMNMHHENQVIQGKSFKQFTEEERKQEEEFIKKNNSYVQQQKLIIKPFEQMNDIKHFCISDQGAKIGRHSQNDILLLDEDVSRFHAEILYKDNKFYIKDKGSTTGTFIRIEQNYELIPEMQIELGSNQFKIDQIENMVMQISIYEGDQAGEIYQLDFNKQSYFQIGRKSDANFINIEADQHLSHIHSKIRINNGKIVIEDMGSTNGTWVRLSPEGKQSSEYLLMNQTKIKIGINHTYVCCFEDVYVQNRALFPNSDFQCLICCEKDRDALISPCNHNSCCLNCAKRLKECPICRQKIIELIKIYKP